MRLREDDWDGNHPNIFVGHDSHVQFFFALAFGERNLFVPVTRHSNSDPVFRICDTELIMANIISLSLHNEAKKVSQSTKTGEARQGMFAFLEAELLWYCCRAFIVWQWNASFSCFSYDWQKWKLKTIQEKREIKTKLISTYGFVITSYFLVSLCAVHLCVANSLYTLEDFKIKCMP